jgi:hypothetical protein
MPGAIAGDIGRGHVFGVTLGFGAARPTVRATAATHAAIARVIVGASAWMPRREIRCTACLNNLIRYLGVC